MKAHYLQRFGRLIGITDSAGLDKVRSTRIAIGGLGLGGAVFINLVRMGFEKFHLADPDHYELTNVGRQRLAKESTLGVRKDVALEKEGREINPDIEIITFQKGVQAENVDAFLKGVDWVVDVIDVFSMPEKLLLNDTCHQRGIPHVSGCSLGFGGSAIVFREGTPSFRALSGIDTELSSEENFRRFIQLFAPEIPAYMNLQLEKSMSGSGHVPFAVTGVEIAAAMIASQISQSILNLGNPIVAPEGMYFNPLTFSAEIFKASYQERSFRNGELKRVA